MNEKKISDLLQEQKTGWFEENVVAHAPVIIAVFANFVVIFADYRAYDVIYTLTGSWWKALAASLACAIPFILWELGWQYNHTTEGWRTASLVMAGLAFATSIVLGVADYVGFTGQWTGLLLGGVVVLTGVHTVMGFLYYYNDPDVARRRRKAQALAKMQDQELNAEVAATLLTSGDTLLSFLSELERKYDPEEVKKVLTILQGGKIDEPSKRKPKQEKVVYAAGSPAVTAQMPQDSQKQQNWHTVQELCGVSGKPVSQIRADFKDYDKFAAWCSEQFDQITNKNMRRLWDEINPQTPPRNG